MPPYHRATRKHPQARGPNLPKRGLPVEMVEAARDDVFRRLVERLRDPIIIALVRPVGGEHLVGPASQKHVELTGDSLVNGLASGVVHEGHGPGSVGEPVPRVLLGSSSGPPGDCMTPSSVTWVMAIATPSTSSVPASATILIMPTVSRIAP